MKSMTILRASALLIALVFASGGTAAAADPTPSLKPAAPTDRDPVASGLLSPSDFKAFETAVELARDGKDARVRAAAVSIGDPVARDAALWVYYRTNDPDVDWRALARFIDEHDDWPSMSLLRRYAEQRMPESLPSKEALAYFGKHAPLTGEGKFRFAEELWKDRERDRARALIRSAWIEHDYSSSEEKAILKEFGKRLSSEDHVDRVDRLLWGRRITAARRMVDLLPDYAKPGTAARIALLAGDRNGEQLFARLNDRQRLDGGVMHAAVRYARRDEREEEAIRRVLSVPSGAAFARDVDAWWLERRLLARWALKTGLFYDAYALAASHGLTVAGNGYLAYSDAEFFAGWIALRFLNEPRDADLHFQRLEEVVSSPISLARARYWRGRAADALGDRAAAEVNYAAAAAYPNTYYGQLSADAIGAVSELEFAAPLQPVRPGVAAAFEERPLVKATALFGEIEDGGYFRLFAHHIARGLTAEDEVRLLAAIGERYKAPDTGVRAGKYAVQDGLFIPDVTYPDVDVPGQAEDFVERALILGLSRQESEFNPRAYSSAGARGPMQLLPSTASITARKEGFPYRRSWLLDRPDYNFVIGAAHLSHLLKRYDGSYVMTLAAYNAGPHRVDRWIDDYGDPRADDVDPVDWVELIPFSETRNYVMRVMENMHVYRHLAASKDGALFSETGGFDPRASMSADLARGGERGRAGRLSPPTPVLAALAAERASSGDQPALPDYAAAQAVIAAIDARSTRLPAIEKAPRQTETRSRVAQTRTKPDAEPAPADPVWPEDEPRLLLDDPQPAAPGPQDAAPLAAETPAAPTFKCRKLAARPDGAIICLDGRRPVIVCPAPKAADEDDAPAVSADDLNSRELRALRGVPTGDGKDEGAFVCPSRKTPEKTG
ncbi:MAG: transglycosylase SLT domain-containing protein [Pseudomonadota bacterium]